jgi:hypothetical protein
MARRISSNVSPACSSHARTASAIGFVSTPTKSKITASGAAFDLVAGWIGAV